MDYEGRVDPARFRSGRVDYCIASLHINCLESGSIQENTSACVKALKNPYVAILGHPDDGRYPWTTNAWYPTRKGTISF